MSPATLQVLAVDDDEAFVDITATQLERKLDYDEVDVITETDAETALDRIDDGIDCIVSDYQMPGMDGLEFLNAVQKRHPDFPFILFTGKGSEEIASEAISEGVTNYVQKGSGSDQYLVLANRIETAVERHQAQQARNAAEQRYTQLVEQTPHAIAVCSEAEILYANDAFADLVNADSREDIVGLTSGDIIHPDHQEEYLTQIGRVRSKGSVDWFQSEIRGFDGRSRLVEITGAPVTYDGNTGVQLIFRDVTERARLKDELERATERFRSVFEHSHDPMLILDPEEEVFRDANSRACEVFGYSREELVSLAPEDLHPHDLDEFRTFMESVVAQGSGWTRELSCHTNDGARVPVEVSASVIEANGNQRVLAILRDLQTRETRERQLRQLQGVATELLTAESRTAAERVAVEAIEEIMELSYAGFHRFDPGTETLDPSVVTDATRDLSDGDVPSFAVGSDTLPWETYVSGETRIAQNLEVTDPDLAATLSINSVIGFPVGGDGLLLVGAPATNAFDPAEIDLARLLATTVDAALDRLAREQELALKDRAIDEADIGITIADATRPDDPIIYANEGFEELTGYDRADVVGENCRFLQGKGTDPETVATIREAIDAEEPVSVDVLNYREDGTQFWNGVEIMPVRDTDGTVTHYLGFQRDVTDRKERERRIQSQKRRLDAILENVPIVLWEIDEDGIFTMSEGRALGKLGPEPGPAVGNSVFEVFADHPEITDHCERALDGESSSTTVEIDDVVFESWYQPRRGDDGEVTGVVGLSYDITERELQERKQKRIIDRVTDAVAKVDDEWEFTLVDRRAQEVLGMDRQTLVGEALWEVFADAQGTRFEEEYRRVMETREAASFEEYYGGIDRWLHVNVYPDDDGGLSFYFRDITDRKEREREIERQNDLFRKTQEIANVGGWTYDLRSDEGTGTAQTYRIHDLPVDADLAPEDGIEFYHPDDRPVIREKFETAIEHGEPYDVELRLITAEDEQRWVRTRGDPREEDGEVLNFARLYHPPLGAL
ncbi:MAG: PAS domain S-box protein [Halobacteriales archaeon]